MVALHVAFAFIVVLLALLIIGIIATDTFQDVKQAFANQEPLKNIEITNSKIDCKKGADFRLTLAAGVERPAAGKRTELITAFIFHGRVSPGDPDKIILETNEQQVQTVTSDFVTAVPKEGEQFTVVVLLYDEKCAGLLKTRPSFEEFTAECAKFLQSKRTLTISKRDEKDNCVEKQPIKGSITEVKAPNCVVTVNVKNTGTNNWLSSDKTKLLLFCKQTSYFPVSLRDAHDLTLKAGESESVNFIRSCASSSSGEAYRAELKANCENENCDNAGSLSLDSKTFDCA